MAYDILYCTGIRLARKSDGAVNCYKITNIAKSRTKFSKQIKETAKLHPDKFAMLLKQELTDDQVKNYDLSYGVLENDLSIVSTVFESVGE